MAIPSVELAAQRALTNAFVAADAEPLTLFRSERISDGAGGQVTQPPVPVIVQLLRFQPRQDGGSPRMTADGEQVVPTYTLVGRHTADIERWDEFVLNGSRYQVVFVYENRQYEVKAEVAYLGAGV